MEKRVTVIILFILFVVKIPYGYNQVVYEKSPEKHLPLWLGGELSMLGALLIDSKRPLPDASLLDRSQIFWLDRKLMPARKKWATSLSDPLVYASIASGGIMSMCANKKDWRTGAVIWGGTIIITQGITHLTKVVARRPRPTAYHLSEQGQLLKKKEYQSFLSGHTSIAVASVVTGSVLWLNWQKSEWTLPAISIIMASGCGLCRIFSGRHFFTDVLTGAIVGATIGVLMPISHEKKALSKEIKPVVFRFQIAF